ncbi:MAG: amidase [Acidobacteria bacterium]|nr:amidase [Acidobacteriota bacterium]
MQTALELRRQLLAREVSAREVLDAHLAVIERRNPELNAIVTFTPELARAQADAADRAAAKGEFLGLLHGLPVAHKDLQETLGIRTTFGSPLFAAYVPDFDTGIIGRMKTAGVVCVGKTNTPEFGAGSQTFNPVFGKTRNPFDTSKTCGGSSGGAAVALATGMIALADGSDTGGSLRNPASFCGVTGLRPTPGLVPILPDRCPDSPLTVNGPMARNAADAGLLLAVLAGLSAPPGMNRDFKQTRVAWMSDVSEIPFEPVVRHTVNQARRHFETLGCVIEEAAPDFTDADAAFRVLRAHEFYTLHHDKPLSRVKETVRQEIERGSRLTSGELAAAHAKRRALKERTARFQEVYEFFVLPTVQVAPFDVEQPYVTAINGQPMKTYIDWMRSCYYVSILGVPALSVPCGFTPEGLPIGLQIVGREGADWSVLQLGHAFEQCQLYG